MGEAIGQMLPAAVGVAFLLGWLVGVGLVGTIVLFLVLAAKQFGGAIAGLSGSS
jgi:hypothetical protein